MLNIGQRARIVKGCNARGITKGTTVQVTDIRELGTDFGHSVKVVFTVLNGFASGKTFGFYARHKNRLADIEVNLNDGNPLHTIRVRA